MCNWSRNFVITRGLVLCEDKNLLLTLLIGTLYNYGKTFFVKPLTLSPALLIFSVHKHGIVDGVFLKPKA